MAQPRSDDASGPDPQLTTYGAGSVEKFRVEFTPTSDDKRFGIFQLYVQGTPIGDGTTTALYPHYVGLGELCASAEQATPRERGRLILGDTFDHLDLHMEMTALEVVLTFTTQPTWEAPPPWAPPVGNWVRVQVPRSELVSAWRGAEPQFRALLNLR